METCCSSPVFFSPLFFASDVLTAFRLRESSQLSVRIAHSHSPRAGASYMNDVTGVSFFRPARQASIIRAQECDCDM